MAKFTGVTTSSKDAAEANTSFFPPDGWHDWIIVDNDFEMDKEKDGVVQGNMGYYEFKCGTEGYENFTFRKYFYTSHIKQMEENRGLKAFAKICQSAGLRDGYDGLPDNELDFIVGDPLRLKIATKPRKDKPEFSNTEIVAYGCDEGDEKATKSPTAGAAQGGDASPTAGAAQGGGSPTGDWRQQAQG